MYEGYLPVNRQDMLEKGISRPDFVYVCGDAYVDHPSFGSAIISRVLEAHGYSVCMLCQPDWRNVESVCEFGEPRLAFLVSSGNMDSMVNHYTVAKKRRGRDAYSPGGRMGMRPDRAVLVYCNLIRRFFRKAPIIIGGLEASLRRLAHYDYWEDRLRRSILLDSGADILSYGMGERSIVEIADALDAGISVSDIGWINGTVWKARHEEQIYDAIRLPAFSEIEADKAAFARSFAIQYRNTDSISGRRLYEPYEEGVFLVQNPPSAPLTETEMDDVYSLPYMRSFHPSYLEKGGVPALGDMKLSITSNRGCFGECNFCALTMHEGRVVQARSHESILSEARLILKDPDFKGYIFDVGGPTAEFRGPACKKQLDKGACTGKRCLWPMPCKNLEVDHGDYLSLLRKLRNLPGVKKIFIRSGFRFDYLMADKDRSFLRELCMHHVSGQMRVAPEHVSDHVLRAMGKPPSAVYRAFTREFERVKAELSGSARYLVPYFMSSHPGCRLIDAIELAEAIRDMGYMPEQVQDFYPTPGTVSTTMYYTGLDPFTLKPVYVPKDPHEKAMQRALMQYRKPENHALVREALRKAHREDLIGYGGKCLVPPQSDRHL